MLKVIQPFKARFNNVAEKISLNEISTGASNDIEVATGIARDMLTVYGMSESLGPISLKVNEPYELELFGDEVINEVGNQVRLLIDNAYVTAIVTGYSVDEIWGYSVNVFLVNKTDKDIMFSVNDASMNGYMADPFFATDVAAGKCSFESITWFNTTLEENNITEVEEIEFNLQVRDANEWLTDDFADEKITLNP